MRQRLLDHSMFRPSLVNCLRITGVHALRLISWTGKTVWWCLWPLASLTLKYIIF